MMGSLSQEQVDFFHEHGYLAYGPLLEQDAVAQLRIEYDLELERAEQSGEFRNLAGESGEASDGNGTRMLQMMQMCERNMRFRRLIHDERILDVVEDLIGPNIMLFHDQALSKPARTGGPVYWHQDNGYWRCRPANLVSCWLTLDDVDDANGAMNVVPGSHLRPVPHERSASTDALLETVVNDAGAVVVDLPAGGCMFHHCQTLHHTKPNRTERPRRAFAIHFMPLGTRDGDGNVMHPSFARPVLRMAV